MQYKENVPQKLHLSQNEKKIFGTNILTFEFQYFTKMAYRLVEVICRASDTKRSRLVWFIGKEDDRTVVSETTTQAA